MKITVTGNSQMTLPAECVSVGISAGFTGPDRAAVVADTLLAAKAPVRVIVRDAAKAKEFAELLLKLTPTSGEKMLAFRHLQQAVMYANAAIAINETRPE